jgi:tetratricopeptide (TPR) repeat protein/DNA-binding CsgD family transcriptional regulator
MQKTQTLFPQDLYVNHLSTINNIHFTAREIDVMACLLSARRTSKTALFLSIDPRTVETHIRNIMPKIGCNTREGIIDFIEASDKLPHLRKYYSLLRINGLFEKSLRDIAKLNRGNDLRCFLLPGKDKVPLIAHLKSHLQFVGITVSSAARQKEGDYIIFALPKNLEEEDIFPLLQGVIQKANKILFLLQERKNHMEVPKEIKDFDVVDFAKHENYYLSFFMILKKLLPNYNFDRVITEFKEKYKKIHTEPKLTVTPSKETEPKNGVLYQIKSHSWLTTLFISVFLGSGFLAFQWSQGKESYIFRSDLIIPTESIFLNRSELIHQIDEKLKRQGDIQTVALVGPGGAGKTTLARQYARMQKANSIWEINAETHESLNTSFEKLAQTLAKTEEDQKVLRGIQEMKNSTEKEEKIIQFIKDRLKLQTNWLLIYDNTVTFADIQKHFPHDSNTWGKGKILITTRNDNIGNNEHVNHVIFIGELTPHQKLTLFQRVIEKGNKRSFTAAQTEEAKKFLEKISPFPLDVSIAAYYIKATNIPYESYLKQLLQNNRDFDIVQENLLKESGDYEKTRYSIIISSLQKLINENKEFADIFLLISMLDSQNIPRDLIVKFKNESILDNFIYNLKKYSLVTDQSLKASPIGNSFSLHRSTQAISLVYLTKILNLETQKQTLQSVSNALENYIDEAIDKEDLPKMKLLLNHCEAFLSHNLLLRESLRGSIESKLGSMYYYLHQYNKAEKTLKNSLLTLEKAHLRDEAKIIKASIYLGGIYLLLGKNKQSRKILNDCFQNYRSYFTANHVELGQVLPHMGLIYSHLGDYKKAKELLETSLILYKKGSVENHVRLARIYAFLGHLNWRMGNFGSAKTLIEKSLTIGKEAFPENNMEVARFLAYLGNVHGSLGNHEKAKNLFEKSVAMYKKLLSEDHNDVIWALVFLGSSYRELKNYDDSKTILEHSLEVYKKKIDQNNVLVAMALYHLGFLYRDIGHYDKAKNLIESSLLVYKEHYGENHLQTIRILRELAKVYLLEGNLEPANSLLNKSLKIYQESKHPDSLIVLEDLSDLYQKKMREAEKSGDLSHSKIYKTQAKDYLKQALVVAKDHFPKDSPHITRIQGKLEEFREVK